MSWHRRISDREKYFKFLYEISEIEMSTAFEENFDSDFQNGANYKEVHHKMVDKIESKG